MFKKLALIPFSLLACLLLAACGSAVSTPAAAAAGEINLTLSSQSFPAGGAIPLQFACVRYGGSDRSPQLSWDAPPPGTRSLALTVTDPDARGFVHWLVYDIPPDAAAFAEGQMPSGAVQGQNGFGEQAYGGPCPPSGTHHYVFSLYALDNPPGLQPEASMDKLTAAIDGHVLARGMLTGTFSPPPADGN